MSWMSNTSTSTPLSISGVGFCVAPYSEWIGRPVRVSRPLSIWTPASSRPVIECSGLYSATRLMSGWRCSRSIVLTVSPAAPSDPLMPVWFVIRPTRRPASGPGPWRSRTSIPGSTAAAGAAGAGTAQAVIRVVTRYTPTTPARCRDPRRGVIFTYPSFMLTRSRMSRGWSLAAGMLACSIAVGACGSARGSAPSSAADPGGDWATRTLRGMSLRQKAAQLIMPRIGGEYVPVGTGAYDRMKYWVDDLGVGGVIVSLGAPLELAAKLNMLQAMADVPLLVAADMEHGPGQVLTGGVILPHGLENGGATRFPPMMALGAAGDEQLT